MVLHQWMIGAGHYETTLKGGMSEEDEATILP
jgi:hypothetical protein